MNHKHLLQGAIGSLLALLLGQAALPAARAQLIQVRPGYVKAPLVRVMWGPDGSSYVRARFVSVGSPGYRPHYATGPVAAAVDCQRMDRAALARTIRESARQLDADLAQVPSGDQWRSRLNTSELAALAPQDPQQPPAEDLREHLVDALVAFDTVDGMPDADRVVSLGSFRMLQAALHEYVTPVEQRLRHQVIAAASELNSLLARQPTGAGWQRYLALPPQLTSANPEQDQPGAAPKMNELTSALGRFDMVSRNPAYRMIAELPAFRATHDSLAAYATWVQGLPPRPAPEELPLPELPR